MGASDLLLPDICEQCGHACDHLQLINQYRTHLSDATVELAAARREGFRAGQAKMRERAATLAHLRCEYGQPHDEDCAAEEIRALPIEDE